MHTLLSRQWCTATAWTGKERRTRAGEEENGGAKWFWRQQHYRASRSKEHVSMERGACERRAPKQIKIGNPYSQICFPNFVGEKEEKSLNRAYNRVPYNRGLYENLFLLRNQLYHLPFFSLKVVKAKHHRRTEIHPQISLEGSSITHHISFVQVAKANQHWCTQLPPKTLRFREASPTLTMFFFLYVVKAKHHR